jgi:hypothetical protein
MGNCSSSVESTKPQSKSQVSPSNKYTLNGFSLQIKVKNQPVNLLNKGLIYFPIPDKSEFVVSMYNPGPTKCDVKLELDGESMGSWRLEANQSIDTGRPVSVKQNFVFKSNAPTSAPTVPSATPQNNCGLITVTYYPEIASLINVPSKQVASNDQSTQINLNGAGRYRPDLNGELYGGGSTLLGAESTQTFGSNVESITQIDQSRVTTLTGRLVVDNSNSSV